MEEWLDVVDEEGNPTGETVLRETAHEKGIPHRTAHVWLLRKKQGETQILLQKRSKSKDSYPGCYDISSAGHILAGEEYLPSALRELKEELGVCVKEEHLLFLGLRTFTFQERFYHKLFWDVQVSAIYACVTDREEEDFHLQKEEVEAVRWIGLQKCLDTIEEKTFPHCLWREELELLQQEEEKIFSL